MQSTPERRIAIRNFLSAQRHTTIEYLMSEFGVSKSTIRRDLEYLETELYVPIIRQSGNCGGIRVIDGWFASQNYLNAEQEHFLRSLIPGLQPEERAKMEDILASFVRPVYRANAQ